MSAKAMQSLGRDQAAAPLAAAAERHRKVATMPQCSQFFLIQHAHGAGLLYDSAALKTKDGKGCALRPLLLQ